ncbi:MAG: TIM barrel protein [Clostridia bacterium]|nr:TIM barrel protein [Clostridia bacterium]
MIKFGPGGNSVSFYETGHKSSLEAPKWLSEIGLNAYEYECGNGVRITSETAKKFGEEAAKYGIEVSVHAPYFISLSSEEEEKREKSVGYILQTLKAAKAMGAARIVVHPGSCSKRDRKEAFLLACETMKKAVAAAKAEGYGDIYICPETMGKINQIGTVEEIAEMCKIDEMLMPTIDFGHINARETGSLKTEEDFEKIVTHMIKELGEERGRKFHVHFSKIEYTKGGEKCHLTFADNVYGPEFEPLAKVLKKYKVQATIICESAGTMTEDALEMKRIYESM